MEDRLNFYGKYRNVNLFSVFQNQSKGGCDEQPKGTAAARTEVL